MEIVITEWALNSYFDLKHEGAFTIEEYKQVIRPDVKLLGDGFPPTDEKFRNPKFWGPAKDKSGTVVPSGYKMKWHNIGNGKVQLRLLITPHDEKIFLCRAYVKKNEKVDQREIAKLKIHLKDINEGRYVTRGRL